MIDARGDIASVYRKIHLFDVDVRAGVQLQESATTQPGRQIVAPVATPAGRCGLAICYDLRFPELSAALVRLGAEIICYPSAFAVPTGMAHWEPLLRARAIETQCYVVAPAQVGRHNAKRQSYGHAMVRADCATGAGAARRRAGPTAAAQIVSPWGDVLCSAGAQSPGLCMAEIDPSYVHEIRAQMPIAQHKRFDVYAAVAGV